METSLSFPESLSSTDAGQKNKGRKLNSASPKNINIKPASAENVTEQRGSDGGKVAGRSIVLIGVVSGREYGGMMAFTGGPIHKLIALGRLFSIAVARYTCTCTYMNDSVFYSIMHS